MDYVAIAMLTIVLSLAIIKIVKINQGRAFKKILYRQTDMHRIFKGTNARNNFTKKQESQMDKRVKDKSTKIVAIDDKAYWVIDNTFYTANIVDDNPDMSTAEPIDTSNMSKSDIDKMLFILDNLDRRKNNERGSTGNE
jgi:hypothetical protein